MNDRWEPPSPEGDVAVNGTPPATAVTDGAPVRPDTRARQAGPGMRAAQKRDTPLTRDALLIVKRDGVSHIITEGYFYKTEAYYTILRHEMEGMPVEPSSTAVLDAYVVPICLERARLAGIPVSEWGISHTFVPTPAVIYGLNYFATSAEYFVAVDPESSKSVIKHITNNGKYPFCFQKLTEGAELATCTAIFGKTVNGAEEMARVAEQVYHLFRIPLVNIVFIRCGSVFLLSALTPTRYSKLSDGERSLLNAYFMHQEFL